MHLSDTGSSLFVAVATQEGEEEEENTRRGTSKHQAILSMDMKTWQDIIDTYGLNESMIRHRKETTHSGPGANGWYT
jgi:hypothetical protein